MKGGEKIMKKIIFLFFLVLFVFILPATVLGGNKPGACYVPSTHITIQSAVNDTECSEIMVAPGNWAGAVVNHVEIANNNFYNSVQAISNWRGNDWNIHHNTIEGLRTRNGGGIGIL